MKTYVGGQLLIKANLAQNKAEAQISNAVT